MIKTDKIRKPQPVLFYIIDYLWSGFAGLSVAMMVVALWAWGSAVFGEFMLPAPSDVFQKALDLLEHFQQNEIGISLWRSVVGITIALVAGLATGLIAGSFKTAMALLKPVITILLAMPPIIWVVMALFWFGFGNPSVLFTIIVLVAPLTFASAAMGMASVNKQHEELFDAYKLGLWKKITERHSEIPISFCWKWSSRSRAFWKTSAGAGSINSPNTELPQAHKATTIIATLKPVKPLQR